MDEPSPRTSTISATVPFISGETQNERLAAQLVFDLTDPYAVTMHLEARPGTVIWTFARELLAEGLYSPSGDGDVQVWPCLSTTGDAVVVIELSSPDGLAMLQAPTRAVHEFLVRTHEVVPEGEETDHLDMDALISQLLDN
jgi:hypothetical protein